MSRTTKIVLIVIAITTLFACTLVGGVAIGYFIPKASSTSQATQTMEITNLPVATQTFQPTSDIESLFKPFWQAWDLVHTQYVDQPVDDITLMRGAIRGMLDSLGDVHTGYMDPLEYQQANAPLEGEYDGIGAWVDTSGQYLTIITPMPNSPAEKAGLKPGDQIIAVDDVDITSEDPSLVLRRVLGPAGTIVKLTIQREGSSESLEFEITRAKITIPSIESEMKDGNIAYIQLTTFGDETTNDLKKALITLLAQNPKGLILDLRYNGGGYLTTAVEVVSQFIQSNQVVLYEEYGDGTRDTYKSLPNGLALSIPMVVLVNEGSASASEITAGALQDYNRATLVGMQTFGKGSVQIWTPLEDQGAVRITVARWLTPKERQIHQVGLTPDIIVEITQDDIDANRDPQLEKAIEILTK
mgnify:FL=1